MSAPAARRRGDRGHRASLARPARRKALRGERPRPRRGALERDYARPRLERRGRVRLPLLAVAVALIAALSLAGLRMEILRLRYQLMDLHAAESQLLDRHRVLAAELGRQRDPRRLRALAESRGFVTPERVIHIPLGTSAALRTAPPAVDRALAPTPFGSERRP